MDLLKGYDFSGKSVRPSAKKLIRTSDGDTPQIEQPVRMVSCDTPEKSGYSGGIEKSQELLDVTKKRLQNGFYKLNLNITNYLLTKLDHNAAANHINAGILASTEFDKLLELRLTKSNGIKRKVAIIPVGEIIDSYGRMLAYISPWYSGDKGDEVPQKNSPERRTFNIDMIENGWAAFFPIYPSLPKKDDFLIAINAAESAWKKRKGAWKEYGENLLLGYEYRLCIKLAKAKTNDGGLKSAFQRKCIDIRNMKNLGEFGFYQIDPCYRLWVWNDDINQATIDLSLS